MRGDLLPFFTGGVYYTLGRMWDDTDGFDRFPANSYDPSGEWARASRDALHRVYVYGNLEAGKLFNLGVVMTGQSGKPYTITTGTDDNRDTRPLDRPIGVARNSSKGPGYFTLDLRWSKDFELRPAANGRGAQLTISLDAFNLVNAVNFHTPVGSLSSPFFGESVSAEPARRIQITGRVSF